ncbi:hypothetical protein FDECE_1606 [Fusarium decemcellulare]|nr:hypothetical protein FDECE_1606 [Fusarium decemcellulare]
MATPSAPLVPIPAKDLHATYHSAEGYLELKAEGEIPGQYFGVAIHRETWLGGLRFSLNGEFDLLPAGTKPPPPQKLDTTLKVWINLPILHFNNKSVIFDTADGDYEIKIKYTDLPIPLEPGPVISGSNGTKASSGDQANNNQANGNNVTGDVLTPIKLWMPAEGRHSITARIPAVEGPLDRPIVNISFKKDFIKIVDASIREDLITWEIEWAKNPTGEGQNPQLVDVITVVQDTRFGGITKTIRIVQPYSVHFFVL